MSNRTEEMFKDHVSDELRKSDTRMNALFLQITTIEEEQAQAKLLLAKNTETTVRVEENTKEMLLVFQSLQGAMRVVNMIGNLAKPLGYIAIFVSSVIAAWVTFKSGMSIK